MKSERPKFLKDKMYQCLRVDDTKTFNRMKEQGHTCDLRGVDLRGLDLRGMDAAGLDFSGSYFRDADLRGIDFSSCKLDGASFFGAKISGALFPAEIPADEIRLSVELGTRMRSRR